jgi:hypothetical protein
MKAYGGVDVEIRIFFYFGTSWRLVFTFTPRPLYLRGNSPSAHWIRRLGGPESRSGRRGEEKILDPTGTRTPTRSRYPGSYGITYSLLF